MRNCINIFCLIRKHYKLSNPEVFRLGNPKGKIILQNYIISIKPNVLLSLSLSLYLSIVVTHLMKSGLMGNKHITSNLSFQCFMCKLTKTKFFPFSPMVIVMKNVFKLFIVMFLLSYPMPIINTLTFIDDNSPFTWVYFILKLKFLQ